VVDDRSVLMPEIMDR